jgi:hypothetical protein
MIAAAFAHGVTDGPAGLVIDARSLLYLAFMAVSTSRSLLGLNELLQDQVATANLFPRASAHASGCETACRHWFHRAEKSPGARPGLSESAEADQ